MALLVRRRKDGDAAGRRDGAAPVDSGATLSVALTGWLAQSLDYAMACQLRPLKAAGMPTMAGPSGVNTTCAEVRVGASAARMCSGERGPYGASVRVAKSARTRARSAGVSTPGGGAVGCHEHRDALAVPHRAQLFERFGLLDRRLGERRITAQNFARYAYSPMWRSTFGGTSGSAVSAPTSRQCGCHASRDHGIGARRSTARRFARRARPSRRSRLNTSAGSWIGCAAVAIAHDDRAARCAATSRTSCGSISGSSPCTLTTIVSSLQPKCVATSARRSVPVG